MSAAAEDQKFFLARLISPRTTFPGDASPEELATMREHVVYWMKHLEAGQMLVFGPVADPAGTWGLGILRVSGESELQALLAGDPVIVANRGFRYETLPMPKVIVRP